MIDLRAKMAHEQPPERVGDYVFEDGRAAHYFRLVTSYKVPNPGPEHKKYILSAAHKFNCLVTGPGIADDEVQVL